MERTSFLRNITTMLVLTASVSVLHGQTNSIPLFSPVNVRLSQSGAGYGQNQVAFNTSTISLTCSAAPIVATLSSTPDSNGNVLADNFINLTVTTVGSGSGTGPVNVCRGGVSNSTSNGLQQSCFNSTYENEASNGSIVGQPPNPVTGGVLPIDISSHLIAGAFQTIKLDLIDSGGYLANSTIYLNTNCTQAGVTGPATITGNPISSTNPTPDQLSQGFPFNGSNNQQVEFDYDLTAAQSAGSLTTINGTIPNTSDLPIPPTTFQSIYLPGTSFATANCLVHTGELLPDGTSACKLYTLTCQIGTGATATGAQCPISKLRNELFQDTFDGPNFTLPDIVMPNGPTFHQGIGFLMANEGWSGGPCSFDPAANLGNLLCPQNLLTNFSGPGLYVGTGLGTHPNSTFISVAPVPEDLTTVTVQDQQPGGWINSQTATVTFSSQPPILTGLQPQLPGQSSFVPALIASITYGTSAASTQPQPSPGLPIPGDITLANTIPCGTTGATASVFAPSSQNVAFPSDGNYLLHYFAQDCAGTEELQFTQDANLSWNTSFYTVPVNVDTVAPAIATGPTLSPTPATNGGIPNSYTLNQHVTANYSCGDDRSGIVRCGTSTFPVGTLNTGSLSSTVDTSTPGAKTFTVVATDAAGNQTTASVAYQVVAPSVNLALLKIAPPSVVQNETFSYQIAAANLGGTTASDVVVTDPLPAGVTFVRATAQVLTCTLRGCSTPSGSASCSFTGNTVVCTAGSLPPLKLLDFSELGIAITVRANAPKGTTITNTAIISSANPESHPGNNSSTAVTRVK